MPLAASIQSASFLPLTLLQALSNGSMWFHLGLELHRRRRHLRPAAPAALLAVRRGRWAAIAFQLNGSIAWLTNAPANPIAVPPAVPPRHRVRRERRRAPSGEGGWILLALGVWLSIVAGFPEVAVINAGARRGLVRRPPRPAPAGPRGHPRARRARRRRSAFCLAAPAPQRVRRASRRSANVGIAHLPRSRRSRSRGRASPSSSRPTSSAASSTAPTRPSPSVWTRIGGYAGVTLLVLAARRRSSGRRERCAARAARRLGARCSSAPTSTSRSCTRSWSTSRGSPTSPSTATTRARRCCACASSPRSASTTSSGCPRCKVLQRIVPGLAVVLVLFVDRVLLDARGRAPGRTCTCPSWYWGSIALFASSSRSSAVLVVAARARARDAAPGSRASSLGAVLVVEAFGFFEVPILAWPRAGRYDTAPVTFLRATPRRPAVLHDRAGCAPNYGALLRHPVARRVGPAASRRTGATTCTTNLNPCILPWQLGNGGPVPGCPITPVLEVDDVRHHLRGGRGQVPPRRAPDPPRAIFMQPQAGSGRLDARRRRDDRAHASARRRTSTRACSPSLTVDLPGGPPPALDDDGLQRAACVHRRRRPARAPAARCSTLSAPLALGSALTITLAASAADARPRAHRARPLAGLPSSVAADGVLLGGVQDRARRASRSPTRPTSIPRLVRSTQTAHIYLLPHPSPIATAPGCAVAAHTMTLVHGALRGTLDAHLPRARPTRAGRRR